MKTSRHIVISDKESALPYSKGLMASSIMATGLSAARAFHVAERIEDELHTSGVESITRAELLELAERVLAEEVGDSYAQSFRKWQVVNKLDRPLVILIGGATGVGKSTLATQLAARLGITRIIPTDAVREVMRGVLTEEVAPALHSSSFDAHRHVRRPLPRRADPLTVGFREQVVVVAVGIRALARRAAVEGTHLIVEGVHAVPGILDPREYADQALVVPLIVTVDDEELHRSHFALRAMGARGREPARYAEHFESIRKLQEYIKSLAREQGTPIVPSFQLDITLSTIIELVIREAGRAVGTDISGPVPVVDPEHQKRRKQRQESIR